jgi:hypothetical protein
MGLILTVNLVWKFVILRVDEWILASSNNRILVTSSFNLDRTFFFSVELEYD